MQLIRGPSTKLNLQHCRASVGKKPACLHHWSDSLPLAGLWLLGTALLQSLLWSGQPTFFSALPVEAVEIFSGSIIQAAMQHQEGKDYVYCLPVSALHIFALSALQFLLGSTSDDFCSQVRLCQSQSERCIRAFIASCIVQYSTSHVKLSVYMC